MRLFRSLAFFILCSFLFLASPTVGSSQERQQLSHDQISTVCRQSNDTDKLRQCLSQAYQAYQASAPFGPAFSTHYLEELIETTLADPLRPPKCDAWRVPFNKLARDIREEYGVEFVPNGRRVASCVQILEFTERLLGIDWLSEECATAESAEGLVACAEDLSEKFGSEFLADWSEYVRTGFGAENDSVEFLSDDLNSKLESPENGISTEIGLNFRINVDACLRSGAWSRGNGFLEVISVHRSFEQDNRFMMSGGSVCEAIIAASETLGILTDEDMTRWAETRQAVEDAATQRQQSIAQANEQRTQERLLEMSTSEGRNRLLTEFLQLTRLGPWCTDPRRAVAMGGLLDFNGMRNGRCHIRWLAGEAIFGVRGRVLDCSDSRCRFQITLTCEANNLIAEQACHEVWNNSQWVENITVSESGQFVSE